MLITSVPEVKKLVNKFEPLYGTSGDGKLAFQHDIANESVVGGSESGTYVTIYGDASQAISEIELLDGGDPRAVAPDALPLSSTSPDGSPFYYGGLYVG